MAAETFPNKLPIVFMRIRLYHCSILRSSIMAAAKNSGFLPFVFTLHSKNILDCTWGVSSLSGSISSKLKSSTELDCNEPPISRAPSHATAETFQSTRRNQMANGHSI
eukprot:scaffold2156_cov115-Cylindrotheca_fusiformis.AAC.28